MLTCLEGNMCTHCGKFVNQKNKFSFRKVEPLEKRPCISKCIKAFHILENVYKDVENVFQVQKQCIK